MTQRYLMTTIEGDPGRVHITMYEGHGAEQVAMRKELTLWEMKDLARKLQAALWARLDDQEKLRAEIDNLAKDIIAGARTP